MLLLGCWLNLLGYQCPLLMNERFRMGIGSEASSPTYCDYHWLGRVLPFEPGNNAGARLMGMG